jgi:small-conductance mechanosensitive channel
MRFAGLTRGRGLLVGVPAALLAVFLVASYLTGGVMEHRAFVNGRGTRGAELVDQTPWQTAAGLGPLAVSVEEKQFAQRAERLADHEVDQAFAMALRQAEIEKRVLAGPALQLQQKVNSLQQMVKEDQARVDTLTAQVNAATKSGKVIAGSLSDDLDSAKAQLQLDTDELNDAEDDLARASGDRRSDIQQELNAREETMKKYDAQLSGGEIAVMSVRRYGTLAGRVNGWFSQRNRMKLLQQAKAETDADIARLTAQHAQLDQRSDAVTAKIRGTEAQGAAAAADGGKTASRMRQAHVLAQIHSILDDRIATEQQLSEVYSKWAAQVELQHRIVGHLILQSLAEVAGILLGGGLLWWAVQALLDRAERRGLGFDPRSLQTMRTVVSLGIQLLTILVLLVTVFGTPKQMPTILGLGAAGLTVVFQGVILAFFGWFVLMGRNGIRVGDWVEINGVGGEVVEIGLFRTALLETGNWTDKGHPTGRRVTFMNSFAVTGSFFNFSTAGQWMWDEISLNVPAGEGSYRAIEAIQKAVTAETEADAKLAEGEWRSATKVRGLSQFSAAPSVGLRPAASGIEVVVRYVTRAGSRFEMRNKLYGTVMGLLHQQEVTGVRV